MEKPVGYYLENYIEPEIKDNLRAGAEVAGSVAKVFDPLLDVSRQIMIREISRALRSIALTR